MKTTAAIQPRQWRQQVAVGFSHGFEQPKTPKPRQGRQKIVEKQRLLRVVHPAAFFCDDFGQESQVTENGANGLHL